MTCAFCHKLRRSAPLGKWSGRCCIAAALIPAVATIISYYVVLLSSAKHLQPCTPNRRYGWFNLLTHVSFVTVRHSRLGRRRSWVADHVGGRRWPVFGPRVGTLGPRRSRDRGSCGQHRSSTIRVREVQLGDGNLPLAALLVRMKRELAQRRRLITSVL